MAKIKLPLNDAQVFFYSFSVGGSHLSEGKAELERASSRRHTSSSSSLITSTITSSRLLKWLFGSVRGHKVSGENVPVIKQHSAIIAG